MWIQVQLRFVFVALQTVGAMVMYMARVNTSVALLSMVNATVFAKNSLNYSSECAGNILKRSLKMQPEALRGSLHWSSEEQSSVISAFYWGNAAFQIPMGFLTTIVDVKNMFILSNFVYILFTILSPLAANLGVNYFIVARFIIGIAQGAYMGCMYVLSSHWMLDEEQFMSFSIISTGCAIGLIVSNSLTGFLASTIGWQWAFYIIGIFSLLWLLLCVVFITNDPTDNHFMSMAEKNRFTCRNLDRFGKKKEKPSIPLQSIFSSPPFLSLIIVHFAFTYNWYIVQNSFPFYVGLVLGFPIGQNGIISSSPFISFMLFSLVFAFFSQWLQYKRFMTVTTQRKLFICAALLLTALSQFMISSAGCNTTLTVLLLCITMGMLAVVFNAESVNYLDIAPRLSGILYSISNSLANSSGFIEPYIKAYFTRTGETRENWWYLFLTGSLILVFSCLLFLIFGSGETQSWDSGSSKEKDIPIQLKENDCKEICIS